MIDLKAIEHGHRAALAATNPQDANREWSLAQWDGDAEALRAADLARLESPYEMAIAVKLGEFPEVVETAAKDLAPHLIAFYLKDLAAAFHSYYNAERILVDDPAIRDARAALAVAVRQVIRNGMAIIGVGCPQSM